jgi:hypothetical protein
MMKLVLVLVLAQQEIRSKSLNICHVHNPSPPRSFSEDLEDFGRTEDRGLQRQRKVWPT